jgi:hypothetical protein
MHTMMEAHPNIFIIYDEYMLQGWKQQKTKQVSKLTQYKTVHDE